MGAYNSSYRYGYENSGRGFAGKGFWLYMAGYAIGSLMQGFIQHHNGYEAGKEDQGHSRTVQLQNEELQSQLSTQFDSVVKLVVNDKEHTFSFKTEEQGTAESCSGRYEVKQDLAASVGNIACTQSVPVIAK